MQRCNRIRNGSIIVLSFLLPILLLLIVFAFARVAPFGEKSLLIMDLSDQYVEFFAGLHHMGEGGDIFYSWGKAMGGNYVGVFSYYLSSPFSFLILLFPQEEITTAILIMNLLKIGCAGLSMLLFLRNRFQKFQWIFLLFSLSYALMSYAMVYSMCLMWLDGVIWLPIVLLGVDRVLSGKFPLIFGVALTVLFISNYYTAYMVVLFAILYFFFRYFSQATAFRPQFFPPFFRCVGGGVFAAGLGMWLLLPAFCALMQGKIGSPQGVAPTFQFNLLQLTEKLLPSSYDSITNAGLPSVFCGSFVLLLVICYFFSPCFPKRERGLAGGILAFLIFSFWIGPLDTLWHATQVPNWFPYRYAFVVSFFMIYLASRAAMKLKQMSFRQLGLSGMIWSILLTIGFYYKEETRTIALIGFLVIGLVLFGTFCYFSCKKQKTGFAILFSLIFFLGHAAELGTNAKSQMDGLQKEFGYKTEASYQNFYETVQPLVQLAKEREDGAFFRMEKDFERSKNDALGFGYNGITHYSSAYSQTINQFLKRIGMSQAYFWNSYYGATPITDALFSVKYLMMEGNVSNWYSALDSKNGVTLYQNPDALALAFVGYGSPNVSFGKNPLKNQELLLKSVIPYEGSCWGEVTDFTISSGDMQVTQDGVYTVYQKTGSSSVITIRFQTEKEGGVYAYFEAPNPSSCTMLVNGSVLGKHFTNETRKTQYLGEYSAQETVEVQFILHSSSVKLGDISIKTLDEAMLRSHLQQIKSQEMKMVSFSARQVIGEITAKEGGYLYTSIPFDNGWRVKIDGNEVPPTIWGEALLAVPISKGTHRIEFSYAPTGFSIGIFVTAGTVIVLILFFFLQFKKKKDFLLHF